MKIITIGCVVLLGAIGVASAENVPILKRPMIPRIAPVSAPSASTNPPGAPFKLRCVKVSWMSGTGDGMFYFRCATSDGSSTQMAVAKNSDQSGYYTPNTPIGMYINDVQAEIAIADVVTTFAVAKAGNPNNGSVLDVSGFYSNMSSVDVVTNATVTLPQ